MVDCRGVVAGSWTQLYVIMYRNYFRKWLLFKQNRITGPEFSCEWQICLDKLKFFSKWLKKGNFCLKKSKFYENLPGKLEIFRKFA